MFRLALTLDTYHLISCTGTALLAKVASLQASGGGIIPVSEVLELLTMIRDTLDNPLPKWVI